MAPCQLSDECRTHSDRKVDMFRNCGEFVSLAEYGLSGNSALLPRCASFPNIATASPNPTRLYLEMQAFIEFHKPKCPAERNAQCKMHILK